MLDYLRAVEVIYIIGLVKKFALKGGKVNMEEEEIEDFKNPKKKLIKWLKLTIYEEGVEEAEELLEEQLNKVKKNKEGLKGWREHYKKLESIIEKVFG